MRGQREAAERLRAREFEVFVGGAAGRLLHVAMLLTGDDAQAADRLLCHALSRAYLNWTRLRGEDPYAYTRQELVSDYARHAGTTGLYSVRRRFSDWRSRNAAQEPGRLSRLSPQERLVLVLRLYEGADEEQIAALVGLTTDRVRTICTRASTVLRSTPPAARSLPAPRVPPVTARSGETS